MKTFGIRSGSMEYVERPCTYGAKTIFSVLRYRIVEATITRDIQSNCDREGFSLAATEILYSIAISSIDSHRSDVVGQIRASGFRLVHGGSAWRTGT